MEFDAIFNEITNKLWQVIIEYMTDKTTIDELADACQALIDFLKFYDSYTNL